MFTSYILTVAAIVAPALIWRALLLDHKKFLDFIQQLTFIGAPLTCGFCTAVWFSLAGILIYNPLHTEFAHLPWIGSLILSWFIVSVGVLFLRNLITVLLEGTGVLTDMHRKMHDHKD
jgi:hypothetical protein